MIYNVNTQTPYRLEELARHNAQLRGEQRNTEAAAYRLKH